jgi:hypothetical protein
VSSIATVLNTVEDAKADLAAVRGPKYGPCLVPAFRDDLRRQAGDAKVENVASEPLAVASFGDGSVGIRLTADLVYPDRTDHLFADLVYMSKDRTTVSATFFAFAQPFPAQLEESLVSRMGHRLAPCPGRCEPSLVTGAGGRASLTPLRRVYAEGGSWDLVV